MLIIKFTNSHTVYYSEISSRLSRFAKRAIVNLSDVSRRSFCLQQ